MEQKDNKECVHIKLESLALWEERYLFTEQGDSEKGFMGYVKGLFEENVRRIDNVAWLKKVDGTLHLHNEFESIFHLLESEEANFLLRSLPESNAFCKDKLHNHIPCTFNRECWGWRILTDEYIWYIALTPWNTKCHFMIYCYYRNMLMKSLAKEKGLPESCYCLLKYSGEIILVRYGASTYSVLSQYGCNTHKNRVISNELNDTLQISAAQSAAMENGIIYGWDTPVANPFNYDVNGYYIKNNE